MLTVAVAGTNSMDIWTHEEADTRIIVHLLDAAEKGIKNIFIRTANSDTHNGIGRRFELNHTET